MKQLNALGAALVAGVVFLVTFLVLDLGFVIALVLAALGFAAGWFLFPSKKPEVVAAETEVKQALADGRQKLDRFRSLGRDIAKPAMAASVAEVAAVIEKILATVAEDPKKLKAAKQFLNYYLDAAVRILSMYTELASKDLHDAGIQASLTKVETTLGTIKDAFEKQLAKLLSGEAMDLDAELTLLQQTLTMEGLGKNP
jgi:5-bromo-4-chloroindolyl phosphate hydrolysis protein